MSYHILVVEDDAVTREKLTGYFEREGYRVTAVENGQEMRAVLAQQEVDLVMLDINPRIQLRSATLAYAA